MNRKDEMIAAIRHHTLIAAGKPEFAAAAYWQGEPWLREAFPAYADRLIALGVAYKVADTARIADQDTYMRSGPGWPLFDAAEAASAALTAAAETVLRGAQA